MCVCRCVSVCVCLCDEYPWLVLCLLLGPTVFRWAAEFRAEPGNLPRNSSFTAAYTAEFDIFHSNNYFFTENDLKVARLQVCL